jgi:hypothetical protein
MRMSIACVLAVALSFFGCSEDIMGVKDVADTPLDVSGVWEYTGGAVKGDCGFLFCGECHRTGTEDSERDSWYARGLRSIEQDGEDLLITDHIIHTVMGVHMQGSVRVYSGSFLCGQNVVDDSSGTTFLYTENGTFYSNDHYESTLALSLSKKGQDGPICKAVWSVTGRRAD